MSTLNEALVDRVRGSRKSHVLRAYAEGDQTRWACAHPPCDWSVLGEEKPEREHAAHVDEEVAAAVVNYLTPVTPLVVNETPEGARQRLTVEMHRLVKIRRSSERRIREIEAEIDRVAEEARPSFPTPAHRGGITEAARRIRDGIEPVRSPHVADNGDYVVTGTGVTMNARKGWMTIKSHSPLSLTDGGREVWRFTEEEQQAMCAIVEESGLTVRESWLCPGGMSIVTVPTGGADE